MKVSNPKKLATNTEKVSAPVVLLALKKRGWPSNKDPEKTKVINYDYGLGGGSEGIPAPKSVTEKTMSDQNCALVGVLKNCANSYLSYLSGAIQCWDVRKKPKP